MQSPYSNEWFDVMIKELDHPKFVDKGIGGQEIVSFAFSKTRYDPVFLQDSDLSDEVAVNLMETLNFVQKNRLWDRYNDSRVKQTPAYQNWMQKRMESSNSVVADGRICSDAQRGWMAAEEHIRQKARIDGLNRDLA